MPTLDTRFFLEFFYSQDEYLLRRLREVARLDAKVSSIVLHELYALILKHEGAGEADTRLQLLKETYTIVDVTTTIAKVSAKLREEHSLALAPSIIAATALEGDGLLWTDDSRFERIPELKLVWVPPEPEIKEL